MRVTQHEMKLAEAAFDRIKSGAKLLELRLYDDKRQAIRPGDRIVFSKFPGQHEKLAVEVIGLLRYADFSALIDDVPASWLGYGDDKKQWLKDAMYAIYTPEEEREYGVLGIRIRKVD